MHKTIQIHAEPGARAAPTGHARSGSPSLTRRDFLRGSAILTGTLATGSLLAILAPSRSWAAPMTVLNEAEAKNVLKLTQVIFPHKDMPEAINALAVKDIDAAADDEAVATDIRDGLAALDKACDGSFVDADAKAQLAAVEASTDSALFGLVRGQCITSLYDNELAYKHFGYEGAAFDKGGYLYRGFNDLSWLPDPPTEASPPMN